MSAELFLMGAQVAGDIASGITSVKGAKKLAREQRKTAEKFKEYNKKKLEKSYENAFGNAMGNFVQSRLQITDEYAQAQTMLNIEASQSDVSLADSSYNQDINNTLEREFNNELQNTYSNLTNQLAELVVNKTTNELNLNMQYMEQLNSINNAVAQVEQQAIDKVGQSVMNFAQQAYGEYRAGQAKDNIQTDFKGNKLESNFQYKSSFQSPQLGFDTKLSEVDFSKFKL